jgi:hypothetical protein
MERFVKQRIIDIVDTYPIGKKFTINSVHSDLFQRHGRTYLPSRAAVADAIDALDNVKPLGKIPRSGYARQ